VVETARFDQAFTFIYSPRSGTPAVNLPDAVPREVAQERFDRLVALVQRSALEKNRLLVGGVQEVLFTGVSKRDPGVLSGRSEGNKVVHVQLPANASAEMYAGRFAKVHIDRGPDVVSERVHSRWRARSSGPNG
jgi:tRNA-2-methylthio-N6-dimethylallyladenosine synthase